MRARRNPAATEPLGAHPIHPWCAWVNYFESYEFVFESGFHGLVEFLRRYKIADEVEHSVFSPDASFLVRYVEAQWPSNFENFAQDAEKTGHGNVTAQPEPIVRAVGGVRFWCKMYG